MNINDSCILHSNYCRFLTYVYLAHFAWDIRDDDVIYTAMPLYHAAGVGKKQTP